MCSSNYVPVTEISHAYSNLKFYFTAIVIPTVSKVTRTRRRELTGLCCFCTQWACYGHFQTARKGETLCPLPGPTGWSLVSGNNERTEFQFRWDLQKVEGKMSVFA